ncbi:MAG: flagella basal body P-ring formation protein FlgA [Armatimonadetes bacterium]|nr:flagella basal body P-ring formation protein FlgA [Armatimonadota bacterium]
MILAAFLIAASPTMPTYEIQGDGYFRLERNDEIVYVQDGAFNVKDGLLLHRTGWPLTPPIRVPKGATDVSIAPDGFVTATIPSGRKTISQIVLAKFSPGSGLVKHDGVWLAPAKPRLGNPGDAGFGVVALLGEQRRVDRFQRDTWVAPQAQLSRATGETLVSVRSLTEVTKSTIRLDDIAGITGPLASTLKNVDLGPAPRIGADRVVTAVTVQSALRSAGITQKGVRIAVPDRAVVRRASRVVMPAEVEAFAKAWIEANIAEIGPVTLNTRLTERRIVAGDLTMRVTGKRDTGKSLILTIEGTVGGDRQFLKQVVFNKTAAAALTVKPGQRVRVVIRSNGVVVETFGKVRSVGAGGQVTVSIEDSKAVLSGFLQPDGSVEVKI